MAEIHIGQNIKRLVERKGYSSRDVSKWLDNTENAVYKLYNRPHVSTEVVYRISKETGIPVTEFLRDISPTRQIEEEPIPYTADNKPRSLTDCERELVITQERNRGLELLLVSKDETIRAQFSAISALELATNSATKGGI